MNGYEKKATDKNFDLTLIFKIIYICHVQQFKDAKYKMIFFINKFLFYAENIVSPPQRIHFEIIQNSTLIDYQIKSIHKV